MSTSSSTLTYLQRGEVLDAISATVKEHFYDRQASMQEWPIILQRHRSQILGSPSDEDFELRVMALLAELRSSHVGFYHAALSRCSAKMALCATYSAFPFEGGERWIFQDIHEGGPAAKAGIHAGDVLESVDGKQFVPPNHPSFPVAREVEISTLVSGLRKETRGVLIPEPLRKKNQLPYVKPDTVVSYRNIAPDTGYIKISMYPGEIGVDFARDVSEAVQMLHGPDRLIIDLRGNTGGGVGFLRVLSLLTPDQLPVGRYENGKLNRAESVDDGAFRFDRIPPNKPALYLLAARFAAAMLKGKIKGKPVPIVLTTEGLGPQSFHGRVALLVDRHTASANEMLLACAQENKLAVVVGEPTPGRVLAGSKFKLPYKYWIALPVGSFHTESGNPIEGRPIEPDVRVPFDPDSAREGIDLQLEKALEVVGQL